MASRGASLPRVPPPPCVHRLLRPYFILSQNAGDSDTDVQVTRGYSPEEELVGLSPAPAGSPSLWHHSHTLPRAAGGLSLFYFSFCDADFRNGELGGPHWFSGGRRVDAPAPMAGDARQQGCKQVGDLWHRWASPRP